MNLALLLDSDFPTTPSNPNEVVLRDRRHRHIMDVQGLRIGDTLKLGKLNGMMGQGRIIGQDNDHTQLEYTLDSNSPEASNICLVLALPRPKMLKRILQMVASLGVKEIYLINSYKVEKSFWSSPALTDTALLEQLILGLEQGVDTQLPNIQLRKRFKPFVEDELVSLIGSSPAYVAHPTPNPEAIKPCAQKTWVAIGPEGGFTEYEVNLLSQHGMTPLSLGPRILRVETAVPVLHAKLSANL